jgi:perosamine synthetase
VGTQEVILKEISELLDSNKLSLFRGDIGLTEGGPMVQRLERAFCGYFDIKHAIAFNSATAALHAACVACNVDTAIVTPFSFTSSVSCVEMAGGVPLFADIDPDTYCMDIATTGVGEGEVIIPVHLFGGMANMDDIMPLGSLVIEDASQAIGSKYKGRYAGTIGDCGIFSFRPRQYRAVKAGC